MSGQKASLEAQVSNLEENVIAAERQNDTIKQELSSERSAHRETKSNWELCKEQLENDQRQHSVDLSRVSFFYFIILFALPGLKFVMFSFRALCRQ